MSGCWLWVGSLNRRGYATYSRGPKFLAHRVTLELVEPLVAGLVVDHKCNTPTCVNPYHLQQVTNHVNQTLRSQRRKFCLRGHEYTTLNTYMLKQYGKLKRQCRDCRRERIAARAKETKSP
jgi:hypothetical protein